jgi:hypothetical protein
MASPLDGGKWGVSFSGSDWDDVDRALDRTYSGIVQPGSKAWFGTISRAKVGAVLKSGAFELLLIHGYLLGMSLDTPWWSDGDKILYEQILLKVDPAASNIRPVIRALMECGRVTGAAGVAVGTALNPSDRKLARIYERHGFVTAAHSLYKELQ